MAERNIEQVTLYSWHFFFQVSLILLDLELGKPTVSFLGMLSGLYKNFLFCFVLGEESSSQKFSEPKTKS